MSIGTKTESSLHKTLKFRYAGTGKTEFKNLVFAPELVLIKNLRIELTLVDVTEKRINDGLGSWRRKGIRILDKELTALHGCIYLNKIRDFRRFILFSGDEKFTTVQYAKKAGINAGLAYKTIYVLKKIKLIQKAGTQGRACLYKLRKIGKRN